MKSGPVRSEGAAELRHDARALLDALPIPAMLVGPNGEVLHANEAMGASAEPASREGMRLSLPGVGDCTLVVKAAQAPTNAQTQRLASLGFMLAGVCHEVSNPLSAIYSMVQILQSKRGVTPETVEKGLASIASNIARVLAITKKLGDFSRVTGDAPGPVAIDDAVDAAAALLRHSSCGAAVGVDYRGAPGASVLARPNELQQVVFNVLLNAAQAMRGVGRIEASARLEGPRVVLTIRDQGPGIPAEHLPSIFDAFFTTKRPGEGTGLGLAISYEIVHELGGSMRASNHEHGGACFEVALPTSGP